MNTAFNYLQDLSPESRERIGGQFPNEIREICTLLSKQKEILQKYQNRGITLSSENPLDIAFQLMHRSASSIMASLELVIGGYMWEPVGLLRNAMETAASGWDIVHNQARFDKWKVSEFKSTKSISLVSKEIKPFGKIYGLFSKMYVHAGPMNAVPSMYLVNGEPELQNFGFLPPGKEHLRASEIYIVLLVAFICLQLTEIIFWKYSNNHETIDVTPGKEFVNVRVSPRHKKFVDASIAHFMDVASNKGRVF